MSCEEEPIERHEDLAPARARVARHQRRATLTEHGRKLEDVIDEYTAAVKSGTTQEFFERVARDRVELDRLTLSEKEGQDFSARFVFAARQIHEGLGEFLKATTR
jgi:hypothetical protein